MTARARRGRPPAALVLLALLALGGCAEGLAPLGPPPAPSERYAEALRDAGLDSTRLGRAWTEAADSALADAAPLALPTGDALAVRAGAVAAWARTLGVRRGEVLRLTVAPALDSARAFVDLFRADSAGVGARLGGWEATLDTLRIDQPIEADGDVLVLVRAELLAEGAVAIDIETAPSLAFPVAGVGEGAIQSRWGAPRDGGARRHEGIDVFADRGTPVVAAAAGRVTRVQETPIGGRVVWLRPDDAPVSLYYAHLDRQQVAPGDRVAEGDTLGTVGNTGNAVSTAPHLHFGAYGPGGAVDPEPFVVGRRAAPRTR